ncbi:lactonase family protein [Pleomorphovibrio marinus]|uniref:lactonase family protein n=1 Tax=Pleomorphovibrio marinus TaxID=2164132 RepID=UPI000E0B4FF4|nr:lactonase family protein [Pleomorphovibrio marinus]
MRLLIILLSFPFLFTVVSAQTLNKEIWYVGTFGGEDSEGVYVVSFDRHFMTLELIQTVDDKLNPSFIALHPSNEFLYVAAREGMEDGDENGSIITYKINSLTGSLSKINEVSSMGESPCHISVDPDGDVVFVSNYQGGNVASYKVREDGGLHRASSVIQHEGSSVHPERQQKPHAHSMISSPDGKFVYASDLGLDKILIYEVDDRTGSIEPTRRKSVKSQPGAGPRHFVFHPTIPVAYSVEELSSTVAKYSFNARNGSLKASGRLEMLSPSLPKEGSTAADIHLSVDGKWLYASNRGQDNMAIFQVNPLNGDLTNTGHISTEGSHPRNFCVDSRGEFLYIANMHSNQISVFHQDDISGQLEYANESFEIPSPSCVVQLFLGE